MKEVGDLLGSAWSQPKMPDGFVASTLKLVADIPPDELLEAVYHLGRTTTWRPNAAAIRRTVVELRGVFPTLAEAGRQAKRYATKRADVASGGPQPLYPFTHPVVADAVAAAGFDLTTPDGGPSFAKAYRETLDQRITEIIAGPLNQPIEFRPVRVGTDREPPADISWRAGGWRNPTGQLIRADSGTHAALTTGPAALTA